MAFGDNDPNFRYKVGGVIALVGGFAFARFISPAIIVPLVIGVLAFVVLRWGRLAFPDSLNGAIAGTIALVIWLTLGVLLVRAVPPAAIVGILVPLALLVWIFMRPSLVPIAVLVVWQALGAAQFYVASTAVERWSDPFRAMVTHIAIRLVIIGFATTYIARVRRQGAAQP